MQRPSHWILLFLVIVGGPVFLAWRAGWVDTPPPHEFVTRTAVLQRTHGERVAAPLPPGERVAEGYLRDARGEVVAGAEVLVPGAAQLVRSDAVGRYRVVVPAGKYRVVAFDDRGRVGVLEEQQGPAEPGLVPLPDLILHDGARLRGALRLGDGGPAANVDLALDGPSGPRRARTDPSGAFHFEALLFGEHTMEWTRAGGPLQRARLEIEVAEQEVELTSL
ncbi:MAG: carboxypeptidase regulatory-like domain-containing protein [Planctomycetes bacterium]|nr:carboxypeptidase regulatory-like domain-containing protein [Planctomycetota bacterium]